VKISEGFPESAGTPFWYKPKKTGNKISFPSSDYSGVTGRCK